jgi:hypothetical protein
MFACVTSFLRERSHDALDVRPLLANQVIVGFSPRLDETVRAVRQVLESDQTLDFLVQVPSWFRGCRSSAVPA